MGQVNVPKTSREVPFDLQMDGSGVVNVQRSGGEGRAHTSFAKLTDREDDTIFKGGKNMTDACAGRVMRKIEGSDAHGCNFVVVREGHEDAGSHRGYVDAVFYIA